MCLYKLLLSASTSVLVVFRLFCDPTPPNKSNNHGELILRHESPH